MQTHIKIIILKCMRKGVNYFKINTACNKYKYVKLLKITDWLSQNRVYNVIFKKNKYKIYTQDNKLENHRIEISQYASLKICVFKPFLKFNNDCSFRK